MSNKIVEATRYRACLTMNVLQKKMSFLRKTKIVSAAVAVVACVGLAVTIIIGIWSEITNDLYWKCIWTAAVILILAGFVHAVAQGMESKEK